MRGPKEAGLDPNKLPRVYGIKAVLSRKPYLRTVRFSVISFFFFFSNFHFSLFSIFYFGLAVLEIESRAGLRRYTPECHP